MINHDVERKIITVLRILSNQKDPVGARAISRSLEDYGISLTERAVRYHLKILDERGLTQGNGKEGRLITNKGLEEIRNAMVSDKIGLVITKIETLSYRTTFDVQTRKGDVILNTSFFPKDKFKKSLLAMKDVFEARLCVSDLVAVADEGETLGGVVVPKGKVCFGTICSVTLNGILLKMGIPVDSRFGGVLQVRSNQPVRFTDLITYAGSSLDPLEVFIRSRMTDVTSAARHGEGKILASFREIPAITIQQVEDIVAKMQNAGLNGLITLGRPNQELFQVSVGTNRAGIVVIGGLNPLAAVEEAGIVSENRAMSTMADFSTLRSFWEFL